MVRGWKKLLPTLTSSFLMGYINCFFFGRVIRREFFDWFLLFDMGVKRQK